jgi:hypothetical protein
MLIPLDVVHHSEMISPPRGDAASSGSDTVRLSALRRGTWMPTERLAMRHVRDVIRLKSAGMPIREIARRMDSASSMVRLTMLTRLNEERPIRRLGVTRRKLLEEIDRPALKGLAG